jgi:hypothetical protein
MDNKNAAAVAKPKDRVDLIKEHSARITEDLFGFGFNETEVLCVLRLAHGVGMRANPQADKTATAVVGLLMADAGML